MVKFLELHPLVSSVNLQLKVAFTLASRVFRAASNRERVRVAHFLIKVELRADHFEVRNAMHHHHGALADLGHDLALLLLLRNNETDGILSLEGASNSLIRLCQANVAVGRLRDSQLELGYELHIAIFAGETDGTFTSPEALNRMRVPASLLTQLTANVDILEVVDKVKTGHPEDSI